MKEKYLEANKENTPLLLQLKRTRAVLSLQEAFPFSGE